MTWPTSAAPSANRNADVVGTFLALPEGCGYDAKRLLGSGATGFWPELSAVLWAIDRPGVTMRTRGGGGPMPENRHRSGLKCLSMPGRRVKWHRRADLREERGPPAFAGTHEFSPREPPNTDRGSFVVSKPVAPIDPFCSSIACDTRVRAPRAVLSQRPTLAGRAPAALADR